MPERAACSAGAHTKLLLPKSKLMPDTIVVVDDEPDIRKLIKLIKLILDVNPDESCPFEASHIEEASRLVAQHFKPDVIRLDIKINGLDLANIFERMSSEPSLKLSSLLTPDENRLNAS